MLVSASGFFSFWVFGFIAFILFTALSSLGLLIIWPVFMFIAPVLLGFTSGLMLGSNLQKKRPVMAILVALLIPIFPYMAGYLLKSFSDTLAAKKVEWRQNSEPKLRAKVLSAQLGNETVYLPMGSVRYTASLPYSDDWSAPSHFNTRKYEDMQSFLKIAVLQPSPLLLRRIHFLNANSNEIERCLSFTNHNSDFWCQYKLGDKRSYSYIFDAVNDEELADKRLQLQKYSEKLSVSPDNNGLIIYGISTGGRHSSSSLILPPSTLTDVFDDPIILGCRGDYLGKQTHMKCRARFMVRQDIFVEVSNLYYAKTDMAEVVVKVYDEANYILQNLAQKPSED